MNVYNLLSYYQAFEKDIEQVSRFIEINPDNFKVYSVELTRLYLSICSEVDVAMKVLCSLVAADEKPKNMTGYIGILKRECSSMLSHSVNLVGFNMSLEPWKELEHGDQLTWWTEHNKVKHHRMEHFKKANLLNVLNSLSALYVINVYILFEQHYSYQQAEIFKDLGYVLSQTKKHFELFRMGDVPFAYLDELC